MGAGMAVGQGSLPAVPCETVHCDKCNAQLKLECGRLPYKCSTCRKVLRPFKDTVFSNLLFALRRGFSISGRSTRKEFWTVDIITSILFLGLLVLVFPLSVLWVECDGFLNPYLCLIGFSLLGSLIILVYQYCISVRRLHDIGYSGLWAVLSVVFSITNVLFFLVPFCYSLYYGIDFCTEYCSLISELSVIDDEACIMYAGELTNMCGIAEPDVFNEDNLEIRLRHPLHGYPFYFSIIDRIVFVLNAVLATLLLVSFFMDSQKGRNKYGLSQKYPVA